MGNRLGEWIRKNRDAQHLTQSELASKLETDSGSVSRWERGKVAPQVEQLRKLCALFGASADEALSLRTPRARRTGSEARR